MAPSIKLTEIIPEMPLASVFFLLAIPHILYAYIWFFPNSFRRIVGARPVQKFAQLAAALKVGQFYAVVAWLIHSPLGQDLDWVREITPLQFLGFLLLAAGGQALNGGIYKAIGVNGVYYGFKLGAKVPWHHGFPFRVFGFKCPHPQYVGSSMSVWACYVLLSSTAPPGLFAICLYWTGLYAITAIWEDYL